ncbi:MAG: MFS transporter [Kiritimatiellae bacterium]|nr:MFS transporter [Kiritimatiellia bacterium]
MALLWVAFFLQQGTRQIFGATLTSIQGSLGASAAAIGAVATVFTFAYGLSVPFAGAAADLFNRKWMVVSGVFVFCLGIFASGFVASLGLMVVSYGILNGFGQSFYYPSATSIVGELHKETRATALSILQMGLYAGIIGCSAASGWLAESGAEGWRVPFKVFGGIGILWAVVMAFGLRNGERNRPLRGFATHGEANTPSEASAEGTGNGEWKFKKFHSPTQDSNSNSKPTLKEAFKVFVGNPSALLLAAGLGMMIYVDVGFKTWMPSHLSESFGVAKGSAALNAVLWHYIGAFVGVTLGGRISDKLVKARPSVRMETNIAGLALAVPFIVWMAYAPTILSCGVAMALFGVFRGVYDSNLMASLFDIIPQRYHASGAGLMLSCAFVFGSTSPVVLGLVKDAFSSTAALASLAGFYLVGAAIIAIARRQEYGTHRTTRTDGASSLSRSSQ